MGKKEKNIIIKEAFIDSIPIIPSYVFLGIAFGIMLAEKGYGIGWSVFAAAFIFAGTLQFALIGMIGSGIGIIGVIATSAAIQARHLFYGLTMLEKYKKFKGKIHKLELFYSLTDETFTVICNRNAEEYRKLKDSDENSEEVKRFVRGQDIYYTCVSAFDRAYWIIGCGIGSIMQQALPFDTKGIDFVMTIFFYCVFVEQWQSTKNHVSAISGVLISVFCLIIFGSADFIIPSMAGIMFVLTMFRKKEGMINE